MNPEWDEEKAEGNYRKHRVGFEEGATIFADHSPLPLMTPIIPPDEHRFIDVGASDKGRVLVVSYTERGGSTRVISCRKATRSERRQYEEGSS